MNPENTILSEFQYCVLSGNAKFALPPHLVKMINTYFMMGLLDDIATEWYDTPGLNWWTVANARAYAHHQRGAQYANFLGKSFGALLDKMIHSTDIWPRMSLQSLPWWDRPRKFFTHHEQSMACVVIDETEKFLTVHVHFYFLNLRHSLTLRPFTHKLFSSEEICLIFMDYLTLIRRQEVTKIPRNKLPYYSGVFCPGMYEYVFRISSFSMILM